MPGGRPNSKEHSFSFSPVDTRTIESRSPTYDDYEILILRCFSHHYSRPFAALIYMKYLIFNPRSRLIIPRACFLHLLPSPYRLLKNVPTVLFANIEENKVVICLYIGARFLSRIVLRQLSFRPLGVKAADGLKSYLRVYHVRGLHVCHGLAAPKEAVFSNPPFSHARPVVISCMQQHKSEPPSAVLQCRRRNQYGGGAWLGLFIRKSR